MERKFYVAMCPVFEPVLDENGNITFEMRTVKYGNREYQQRYQCREFRGKYRPFGTNGKVVSVYDTPAKARRYAGKSGYAMEIDPADGLKVDCTLEERMLHCEARMLFWGQEQARIEKELRGG